MKIENILMLVWFLTAPALIVSRFAVLAGQGNHIIYYMFLAINAISGFGFLLLLENGSGMK